MTQEQAIQLAMEGHNIFLTGQAGTGKSYTLNRIIEKLKNKGRHVAITASTGIASTHINGSTIHSWAGIGIMEVLEEDHLYKLKNNHFSNKRIYNADVLIIDEISMLHNYRFDMVEKICRFIRDPQKLFGGIQIIVSGDFYQLPPVNRNGERNYCFDSRAWVDADFIICYLTKIYRQENDLEFIDILNGIRNGTIRPEHYQRLHSLSENIHNLKRGINLYCTNKSVDVENSIELNKLPGKQYINRMISSGIDFKVQILKRNVIANELLILKENAKIMLLINDYPDRRYVNGTLCRVIQLENFETDQICKVEILKTGREVYIEPYTWKMEEDDKEVASVIQFPIKVAYAITIHKSQGATFDYVNLDLSDVFVENMGYVALSRATSLDGIFLKGFNELSLKIDPIIVEKDIEFRKMSRGYELQEEREAAC